MLHLDSKPQTRHLDEEDTTADKSRALGIAVLASLVLACAIAAPLAAPLVLGGALSVCCQVPFRKLARALERWPKLPARAISASLCTLSLFLIAVAPLSLAVGLVAKDVRAGLDWLREQLGIETFGDWSQAHMPESWSSKFTPWMERLHLSSDNLREMAQHAAGAVKPLAGAFLGGWASAPAFLGMTLLAFFFLLMEGRKLPPLIEDISPLRRAHTRELLESLRGMTRATVLGNLTTALTQTVGLGLAFWVAHVPHPALFALFALPASFIPVAGSALVYLPVVAGMALGGHMLEAGGLLLTCMLLSTFNTNIVKPWVLQGGSGMHPGLVLLSIVGGIQLFGMIGLVAGPLGMVLCTTLLGLYRRTAAP